MRLRAASCGSEPRGSSLLACAWSLASPRKASSHPSRPRPPPAPPAGGKLTPAHSVGVPPALSRPVLVHHPDGCTALGVTPAAASDQPPPQQPGMGRRSSADSAASGAPSSHGGRRSSSGDSSGADSSGYSSGDVARAAAEAAWVAHLAELELRERASAASCWLAVCMHPCSLHLKCAEHASAPFTLAPSAGPSRAGPPRTRQRLCRRPPCWACLPAVDVGVTRRAPCAHLIPRLPIVFLFHRCVPNPSASRDRNRPAALVIPSSVY